MRLTLSTLAAVLLALAGCATPIERGTAPELPARWHAAEAQPRSPGAELAQWWRGLDDPLLVRLIEDTLAANPELAGARAALRESRARATAAGAARSPELALGTAARRSDGLARYSASLDASWEIDLFGAIQGDIDAASAELQASAARLADVQVSLAAETALQYVGLIGARQRLQLARANLAGQSDTLQIIEWRLQAGLASEVELAQARSSREQTAATLPAIEAAEAAAMHALATLTATSPAQIAAGLAELPGLPAVPDEVAVGIPAELLTRRPDLRGAAAAVEAEAARLGAAQAALLPSLRLSGSIGSEALGLGALGSGATLTRLLAASLSATLFDQGRREALRDAQQAALTQAQENFRLRALRALQEVEDALVGLATDAARGQALARAGSAARTAAQLARQRYQSGLIDFQTVLDTERNLRATEDAHALAQTDRLASLIRLYKALGGGWPEADRPATRS